MREPAILNRQLSARQLVLRFAAYVTAIFGHAVRYGIPAATKRTRCIGTARGALRCHGPSAALGATTDAVQRFPLEHDESTIMSRRARDAAILHRCAVDARLTAAFCGVCVDAPSESLLIIRNVRGSSLRLTTTPTCTTCRGLGWYALD